MDCCPVVELNVTFDLCRGNMRPFVEGSELTTHGVMCIGQTMDTLNFAVGDDIIKVFALIMQASHSDEIPHVVKVSVKRVKPLNKVVKTWCSCLSGQGVCKHIIAVCMRLFRITEEMLEPISCTDTIQQWGKCSMKKWSDTMFRGTSLDNMCHFQQSKSHHDTNVTQESFGRRVREMFKTDGDQSSELSKFMRKTRCTNQSKPPVSSLHKSMKRAIRKVHSCPIATPSPPTKGQRGNKVANSKNAVVNKENIGSISNAESSNSVAMPASESPRRPLGSIQPSATSTPLVQNTSPSQSVGNVNTNQKLSTTPSRPIPRPPSNLQRSSASAIPLTGPSESMLRRTTYERNRQERPAPAPPSLVSPVYVRGLVNRHLPPKLVPSNLDSLLRKDDEQYFLSKVCLTPEESTKLCLASASQSSTKVWKDERKKRFTASKCYQLFTPQTPLDDVEFWERKLHSFVNTSFWGNFNTNRGLEDEVFARRRYEIVHELPVKIIGLVVHPDMPWLGCSPDGVVENRILFETKLPESGIVNSARDAVRHQPYVKIDKNGNMKLSSRHPYYGQVQMAMALTGLRMCHFVVYASSDDSIVTINVPYDEVFAESLIQKLTRIYFQHYLRILREANV